VSDASIGDFAEAMLSAPVGVAALAAAEGRVRDNVTWFECPVDSDLAAVQRASARTAAMRDGEFLALVLHSANRFAGPWTPGAPAVLAAAYEVAAERRLGDESLRWRAMAASRGDHRS
jgi:hypothetical protein